MMSLDQVAQALGGEASDGQVRAPGPGHSASDRSLSVKLDPKAPEGFLVNSFAEDDPIACRDYVRKRLGLPEFEPKKAKSKASGNGEWKFVREHVYRTADGTPHVRKQKKIDPKGEKQFPQSHWVDGKWVSRVPKTWPKVLYRLPELMKAPEGAIVYVTEGEGDADALAKLGFVATTAGGVSSEWTAELAEPLKGRRVVIVVDSDTPGRAYGEKVARALDKVVDSLKVVDLFRDDVAEKNGRDTSDFLKSDRAGVSFVKAVKDAPEWEPSAEPECSESDADKLIAELAELSTEQYERERKKAAERLGFRATVLDRLVAAERARLGIGEDDSKLQGRALSFAEPEPWPDKVSGTVLLDAIAEAIGLHVIMSEHERTVAALWSVHAYLLDRFIVSPRLAILSPVKRCGKTTLLDIFARLVARALSTTNVTAAAIFRVVEMYSPTLLIDELDSFLRGDTDLLNVLNSGHRRGGSVLRTVGDNHDVRSFNTYAACVYGRIGNPPDTLLDRSVVINLKRRLDAEKITPFRIDRTKHLDDLARQIARWTRDNAERIGGGAVDPAMPTGVYNREADNWRPLLAIADAAGGDWPKKAREAATSGAAQAEETSRLELALGDIRDIFAKREENKVERAEEIPSAVLVSAIVAIEGHPWAEMGKSGKPLTQAKLARILKPLKIAPEPIGLKTDRVRGYTLKAFEEAFNRFLPPLKPSTRPQCDEIRTSDDSKPSTPEFEWTVSKSKKSNNDGPVDGWTPSKGETGEGAQTPHENGAEPGLPHAVIRRLAARHRDAAADQLHATGDVDRQALDAELRRILIEEESVSPEHVEIEFERVMKEVFRV